MNYCRHCRVAQVSCSDVIFNTLLSKIFLRKKFVMLHYAAVRHCVLRTQCSTGVVLAAPSASGVRASKNHGHG